MDNKIAIIDLGSNSVRMLIMKIMEDLSYKIVDQAKVMVRLSENMGEELILKPEPIKRTIDTLHLFKRLIEAYEVNQVRAIATAAVRSAENREEFLDKVKNSTGFEFEVIPGEKEAYYDYLGIINTMDKDDFIMIDTGGASTEIALIRNRKLIKARSFPIGAVNITEDYLKKEGEEKGLKKLEKYLSDEFKKLPWLRNARKVPIVGLGGSIRTLAKIDRREIAFPLENLHNYKMSKSHVDEYYERVIKEDVKDRKKIGGISKDRGDIILGGLTPVKFLMDFLNSKELTISGHGLREGVFYEEYLINEEADIIDDVLDHSINNTLKKYDVKMSHAMHVRRLSEKIFEGTFKVHGLGDDEKKLLLTSALIHDIGMYVDYYNHHRHGFYLSLNSKICGFSNRELLMCAYIVGMHREDSFKESWKNYDMIIDKEDYETIKVLSLFVKIAEKLDRSEYGNVKDLNCIIEKEEVKIVLYSEENLDLEVSSVMRIQSDFENIMGKTLNVYQE